MLPAIVFWFGAAVLFLSAAVYAGSAELVRSARDGKDEAVRLHKPDAEAAATAKEKRFYRFLWPSKIAIGAGFVIMIIGNILQ